MSRPRLVLGLGAAVLVAGAAAAAAAPPPPSIGPDVVGWWSAAHRSAAVPAVAPPDVGAKDLYVAGSNALPSQLTDLTATGPAAIAALRFRLPEGAAVKELRLTLAGTHPPAVTLAACRATKTFTSAYDGSWADAPAYDCANSGTARLGADGSVVIDGVDALRRGRDLAVVLVPGPLDRVVVAPPDRHTLLVTKSAGTITGAPGAGAPLPSSGSAGAPSQPMPAAGATSGLAPATGALPAGPASGAAPAVAPPAPVAAPQRPAALGTPALPARPWPTLLATLLLAAAAFLPIVRPMRRRPAAGVTGTRGVGRFRSERSGAVPDLV